LIDIIYDRSDLIGGRATRYPLPLTRDSVSERSCFSLNRRRTSIAVLVSHHLKNALVSRIVGQLVAVAESRSGQGWRKRAIRREYDSTQDVRLGASGRESAGTDSLA